MYLRCLEYYSSGMGTAWPKNRMSWTCFPVHLKFQRPRPQVMNGDGYAPPPPPPPPSFIIHQFSFNCLVHFHKMQKQIKNSLGRKHNFKMKPFEKIVKLFTCFFPSASGCNVTDWFHLMDQCGRAWPLFNWTPTQETLCFLAKCSKFSKQVCS